MASTARLPAGSPLDALTGGLWRGRICELVGPRGSGRMSAVLAMAAAAQETGELVALVDLADALDPPSAAAAGVELRRLLWVRPGQLLDGLKAVDWLLDAGGFGLVLLYLAGLVDEHGGRGGRTKSSEALWRRLAQRAERARTALVVAADRPLVGAVAALSLQTTRGRAQWLGGERGAPRLLAGVTGQIAVTRSRQGAPLEAAELRLHMGER